MGEIVGDRKFDPNEWVDPKPMTVYWALMKATNRTAKSTSLILVLENKTDYVKLIELKRGKLKHDKIKRVSKQHLQIIGLASDVVDFNMNDFLTADSEVIRRHALLHMKGSSND